MAARHDLSPQEGAKESLMAGIDKRRPTSPAPSDSPWIARLAATVGTPAFDDAVAHAVHGSPFAEYQIKQPSTAAELLMSFLRRHYELKQAAERSPRGLTAERASALVGTLRAGLPRRECEVCARILRGFSMQAAALDLGIAESTAITYKRRAYARLGISGTPELFARCLEAERD
jgi:DNA-binding CsgD family transcriptional regulator